MGLPFPDPKWDFRVYQVNADGTQGAQLIGPITNITSADRDRAVWQHYQYQIRLKLWDINTTRSNGGPSSVMPIAQGQYCELFVGNNASARNVSDLWIAGYIQNVQADESSGELSLTVAGSSIELDTFLDMAHLKMQYSSGNYPSILDFLSGSGTTPGTQGVTTGSGWGHEWVDGALTFTTSAALSAHYGANTPGRGDSWRTDNESAWQNEIILGQHYNYFGRPRSDSRMHNGTMQVGPLGDSYTGATIWGGVPLASRQGRDTAQFHHTPDLQQAQQDGDAAIINASYNIDLNNVINMVWPIGGSQGHKSFFTLRPLVGGKPVADDGVTIINGWTAWKPFPTSRQYYVKAGSKTTYDGHTFEFVAVGQDNGGWQYGIVDRTSVTNYGPKQRSFVQKKIHHHQWLLSAALGFLTANADPIPQWTFQVQHPLTSASGVPNLPDPGMIIDVQYSGEVHDALEMDWTPNSATYGQLIGVGPITFLTFPGPWATTPDKIAKIKKVIEIQDSWDDQNGFTATYTLGRGKLKRAHIDQWLARRMSHSDNETTKKHEFVREPFHHWPFYFNDLVSVDITKDTLTIKPGGLGISDVPDGSFFDKHNGFSFDVSINDAGGALRVVLCKAVDEQLTQFSSGSTYLVYQIAGTNSALSSGFYTTQDGLTFTHRGGDDKNSIVVTGNSPKQYANGNYRFQFRVSDGHWEAICSQMDSADHQQRYHVVAHWSDKTISGSHVLAGYGAIGWWLFGGAASWTVSQVNAHEWRHRQHNRTGAHPHTRGKSHIKNGHVKAKKGTWPSSGGGGGTLRLKVDDVSLGPAKMQADSGDVLQHDDGTDITWPASVDFTGFLDGYIIYNTTDTSYTDGTYTVPAKTWGVVTSLDTTKEGNNGVFLYGHVAASILPGQIIPHIELADMSIVEAHYANLGSESVGKKQSHPSLHHRGHFSGASFTLPSAGTFANYFGPSYTGMTPQDILFFVTDDASGESAFPGRYRILEQAHPYTLGQMKPMIGPSTAIDVASLFPASGPGNCTITFTRLFPGILTSPTSIAGSLLATSTYTFRYCFTATINGKTVESALSPPITMGTGATGWSFLVDVLPPGWTGYRLYAFQGGSTDSEVQQISGTNYSITGTTISITSYTAGTVQPSYGFTAWAAGTDLVEADDTENLMKVATIGGNPDPQTNTYDIRGYHTGMHQSSPRFVTTRGLYLRDHANSFTAADASSMAVDKTIFASKGDGTADWRTATDLGLMTNPMIAANDMIVGGTPVGGVAPPVRLPSANNAILKTSSTGVESFLASAANQVLITNTAGAVSWSAAMANGSILYKPSGAAITALATTANGVLTGNGTSIPTWLAPVTNGLLLCNNSGAPAYLAPQNSGVLISGTTGIPSWLTGGTTGQVLTATTGGAASWQAAGASGIPSIKVGSTGTAETGAITLIPGANISIVDSPAGTFTISVDQTRFTGKTTIAAGSTSAPVIHTGMTTIEAVAVTSATTGTYSGVIATDSGGDVTISTKDGSFAPAGGIVVWYTIYAI